MKINPEKIAAVIGPGGKIIRALTAETGANIEIEDDGTIKIFSSNLENLQYAVERIKAITEEVEIGKDYWGTVRRIEPYGAFIEVLPGTDGLLHVSRMANYRVENVTDELSMGEKVLVRIAEVDSMGKVKLTREELMREGKVEGKKPAEEKKPDSDRPRRPPRRDDNRGSRDRSSYPRRRD